MRQSLSYLLGCIGSAVLFAIGCGSEAGSAAGTFECNEAAIAHGQATSCQAWGQFGASAPSSYTCVKPSELSIRTRSVSPRDAVMRLCPPGTIPVPQWPAGNGSSGGAAGDGGTPDPGDDDGSDAGVTIDPPDTNSDAGGGAADGGTGPSDASDETDATDAGTKENEEPTSPDASTPTEDAGTDASVSDDAGVSDAGTSTEVPEGCERGYECTVDDSSIVTCVCGHCEQGYHLEHGQCVPKGNNGVGNGVDPAPPGNPPENDGEDASPGNPGNKKNK